MNDEERAYAIRQGEDVREVVIARAVTHCLNKRGAFSLVLGIVLCFMVEDHLTFEEATVEYGRVMFEEENGVTAYNCVVKRLEDRDITEDPELWFSELEKEVRQIADRVLAG